MATDNRTRNRFMVILTFTALLLGHVSMAQAGDDHDEARKLLEAGEILSLDAILNNIKPVFPGKVLEVELERERERLVYEMEILGDDGVVRELYVDARSGEILSVEEDD